MARDIRIEEAINGFTIRIFEPPKNKDAAETMFPEPDEIVAITNEQVMDIVTAWLKKEDIPKIENTEA